MNNLVPVVLAATPELGRWLFGEESTKVASQVTEAAQSVTGTVEPDALRAALQQNPDALSQFRVRLGEVAASWDKSVRADELMRFSQLLATASKEAAPRSLPRSSASEWAAPAISAGVLGVFALMMSFIMVRGMPPGTETAVNLLLGTLAAMATSVVSYWVGSSAGSARKDDRLAQLNR